MCGLVVSTTSLLREGTSRGTEDFQATSPGGRAALSMYWFELFEQRKIMHEGCPNSRDRYTVSLTRHACPIESDPCN